jgi:uncharacterized protein YcfJ
MSTAHHHRADPSTRRCPAVALSAVLSHYFGRPTGGADSRRVPSAVGHKRPLPGNEGPLRSDTIALLKVDVEGDELEVLHGIAAAQWSLIRRVVAEVHPVLCYDVSSLLREQGYDVRLQEDPQTGNSLVFATRGQSLNCVVDKRAV